MDEVSAFNQSKWDELVSHGVLYSRPLLNLTPQTAREYLDPFGLMGDVTGEEVLCLASAGGRQTAAFAVLGASVHVLDLSPAMLQGDHKAAARYGVSMDIQQGDMRDLSRYPDASFDRVFQPYSINFIPDPMPVFQEVARVLKPGGFYTLEFHNPFLQGLDEADWDGRGYPVKLPYIDGAEIIEPRWEFNDEQGNPVKLTGPRAFRHTMKTILNALAGLGFILFNLYEEYTKDASAEPGSWDHFLLFAPPWMTGWFVYRPEVMRALLRGQEGK